MPHYLVTGCAGFIGSHVCEHLLANGHQVTGIDNFSRFYARNIKERNMSGFFNHSRFAFHEVDIRNKEALFEALPNAFDGVIHLAAKAGVRPSISDPSAYIDVNIHGTHHLLQLMEERGMKKMFFASSSSVYGNQKQMPFNEATIEDKPISPYAFTKRAAELMNYTYHHLKGFDIICARFFTVYGPRQRPDLAIHKFVKLVHNGEAIPMFGDGETARDYTFIDDTVKGILGGVNYLQNNDGVYEIINLGNKTPVKLHTLITTIGRSLGKEPEVTRLPMQEGDVDITWADISKAQKLIGYAPEIDIETGIQRFTDWYAQTMADLKL